MGDVWTARVAYGGPGRLDVTRKCARGWRDGTNGRSRVAWSADAPAALPTDSPETLALVAPASALGGAPRADVIDLASKGRKGKR